MSYRLGIDVGGTFTDVLLINDATGAMIPIKTPTTPHDQSQGVLNGIFEAAEAAGIDPSEILLILHGTTVATNAVLEGKGAKMGLLVTRGFRNILHLARSWTPGPLFGWMIYKKPDPLVPLTHTYEVHERIDSRGNIVEPLDEEGVRKSLERLFDQGIEALTVCLLNSYANPVHEQRIKEIALSMEPDLAISISSEILPEFKEYERTLTTVMNSYVKPKMRLYLGNLASRLEENHIRARLNIVRSDGGLMSVRAATDKPVHTMLSGPSGGVSAVAHIGNAIGFRNILTFDMGGTSTDVSMIRDGKATATRTTKVGDFPVKAPSVDVVSIGAGGGSIAYVPEITGALRVGPQSAGAVPGPACYGRGGTEPTVCDANVVLGRLPEELLDGAMKLDVEAAHRAVQKIADALGMDVYEAAQGILDIVNENMFGALRVVTVERGFDPRDFALAAFGGAGPLHANSVAVLSGSYPVIVPPEPGVLSALGFNATDYKNEFARTYLGKLDELDPAKTAADLEELRQEAIRWLEQEQIPEANRSVEFFMDVRYYLQGFEIPMQVTPEDLLANGFGEVIGRFHEVHERLYHFRMDTSVEVVNIRAVAIGRLAKPKLTKHEMGGPDASAAIVRESPVYFDIRFVQTPIYRRSLLKPGNRIHGPAIVTQYDTTTVILPGHVAVVDEYMNILIHPGEGK